MAVVVPVRWQLLVSAALIVYINLDFGLASHKHGNLVPGAAMCGGRADKCGGGLFGVAAARACFSYSCLMYYFHRARISANPYVP